MWKSASKNYFSKKFGSTSKNMPQEELNIIYSIKDLVYSNMLKQLDSKISNICESKLV